MRDTNRILEDVNKGSGNAVMNLAEQGQLKLNFFYRGRPPKETIEPGQILEPEAPGTM